MIAVNEVLGYEVVDRGGEWQLDLEQGGRGSGVVRVLTFPITTASQLLLHGARARGMARFGHMWPVPSAPAVPRSAPVAP
nr:hypothetical protein [Actinomycetota bacterium]